MIVLVKNQNYFISSSAHFKFIITSNPTLQ